MTALCHVENCRRDAPPRLAAPGSAICDVCAERAYENLREVERLWPELDQALIPGGGGGQRVTGTKENVLPYSTGVADARGEITHTLWFWTKNILDVAPTLDGKGELASARERVRFLMGRLAQASDPKKRQALLYETGRAVRAVKRRRAFVTSLEAAEPAFLAGFVATNLRTITHGPDEWLAVGIVTDARTIAGTARGHVAPSGRHTYKPGIPCVEHTTDGHGQRVPCGGEYVARVQDGMGYVPDLVCTVNGSHVMTPGGFRTLGRSMDKGGAERLLGAIVGRMGA